MLFKATSFCSFIKGLSISVYPFFYDWLVSNYYFPTNQPKNSWKPICEIVTVVCSHCFLWVSKQIRHCSNNCGYSPWLVSIIIHYF